MKKLILITGATGNVGALLRPSLQPDYRLRLHYRRQPPSPLAPGEESVQGEITDFAAVARMVAGVDAIVHLAAESNAHATWEAVRGPNIDGLYTIFEAARQAGVSKIVFSCDHLSVSARQVSCPGNLLRQRTATSRTAVQRHCQPLTLLPPC